MPYYIQIGDDPTKWWLAEPIQASQLAGQPLVLHTLAPIVGTLVLSPKSASVAIFDVPTATVPQPVENSAAAIYVPTAAGPTAADFGYELALGVNAAELASQIVTLMRDGGSQAITLGGSAVGGTLVLNGATLGFVVIRPGAVLEPPGPPAGDSSPHGAP